jgi:hypothetical protein
MKRISLIIILCFLLPNNSIFGDEKFYVNGKAVSEAEVLPLVEKLLGGSIDEKLAGVDVVLRYYGKMNFERVIPTIKSMALTEQSYPELDSILAKQAKPETLSASAQSELKLQNLRALSLAAATLFDAKATANTFQDMAASNVESQRIVGGMAKNILDDVRSKMDKSRKVALNGRAISEAEAKARVDMAFSAPSVDAWKGYVPFLKNNPRFANDDLALIRMVSAFNLLKTDKQLSDEVRKRLMEDIVFIIWASENNKNLKILKSLSDENPEFKEEISGYISDLSEQQRKP